MNIHATQGIPMHKFRISIALALASSALAACSPKPAPQSDAAPVTTPASVAIPAPMPENVAVAQEDERKCTNEPRTDESDKRPRCGGMGAPQAEPSHAYRITLNGETITACDITKPFSGRIGGGLATLSFNPADDRGGTMAFHFANGRGVADTAYNYTLSGPEEKMTGTFHSNSAICGKAAGLGACAVSRTQTFTSTWTRIEDCDK